MVEEDDLNVLFSFKFKLDFRTFQVHHDFEDKVV